MFHKVEDASQKTSFLDKAKLAREEREKERLRETSAVVIQKHVRGFITRCRVSRQARWVVSGKENIS